MVLKRRSLLALVAASPALPALAQAPAGSESALLSERSFGSPNAKETVTEFFSLTCTHCAAFSRETMPEITKQLIEPGKVRFVYRDFPLDQVALMAAMVARALPPERYEPFISALFASQDRWAFARDVNTPEELWKMAALAGMSRATFDAAIKDEALKKAILQRQQEDTIKYNIDSTPTFRANNKQHAGEMDYAAFVQFLNDAYG